MTNPLLSMFVFPAPQPSYTMHSFPNELLWMPWLAKDKRSDDGPPSYAKCQLGDCIPAVFLRSPAARYMVIYLHSNGEDIGLAYPFGCGLRMVLEVHVLLVEYPGYGICPGECSEETMWQCAQSAVRFANETLGWPLEDVIIMGRSIGAAVATRLACTYACHGLILVAPFLSLVDAVTQYVGALAPMLVSNSSFSTKELITNVNMPMLLIHGMQDRLISCSQGQTLWELCPHKKKLLVCPETMSHNTDLLSNADYLIRPMLRFFALPDYSFVDLIVPPEAYDKRHCPQYHKLVETVKTDKPLPQPQGDEEPCPVGVTSAGPSSVFGPCNASGGDDDDLAGSNEFSVRTPSRSLSPRQRVSRKNSALVVLSPQAESQENDEVPNSGIHLLDDVVDNLKICEEYPDDTRRSSATALGDAVPATSSNARQVSGLREERAVPSGVGSDQGLADGLIDVADGVPDNWNIDPPKAFDKLIRKCQSDEEKDQSREGAFSPDMSEREKALDDSTQPAEPSSTLTTPNSDNVKGQLIWPGMSSGRKAQNSSMNQNDHESKYVVGLPSSPSETHRVSASKSGASTAEPLPIDANISPSKSPSKISTRTDSFEGPVADEQDKDWAMPAVPSDSRPGSDTEWPVHPGIMPTLMYGKPSQKRSNLATTFVKPPALDARAVDPSETSWEEGSTVPPTAEASHVSRRTHELSDCRTMSEPDCVMAPVPGICILNINDGISRFLHEGESLEQ